MNRSFLIFHKIQFNLKENGFAHVAKKLSTEFWKEITKGGEHLFYVDSEDIIDDIQELNKKIDIQSFRARKDIPINDIEDLKQFVKKKYMNTETCEYYLDQLLEIFQNGGEITVGRLDDRIVGFLWRIHSHDRYQSYFRLFPMLPNDGLVFAGYALPEYRGMNIIPTLIRYNSLLLKKEGARRVLATCKEWNTSSQRCILKGKLKQIRTARPFSIFGKQFVIWY